MFREIFHTSGGLTVKSANRYNGLTVYLLSLIKFPLYKNNSKSALTLTTAQRQAINAFMNKISSGLYNLEDNPCMCGGHNDVVVTEKDRYGISCRYVLCRNCGLVRLEKRLDDVSTALFYRDDYRNIYVGEELASEEFFAAQIHSGERFCTLAEEHTDFMKIHSVFEAGCGAGGILYAFKQRGKNVSGCDFGQKYLQCGQEHGIALYEGEPDFAKTPPNSQDLVILSHVLEHLNRPLDYLNTLIEMTAPEGFLLIQVPGILSIREQYSRPIGYFQNAHVNNFYGHYLECLFTTLGLDIVCGDEVCTFLLRKPKNWTKHDTSGIKIWDETMPEWSRKIELSLKRDYLRTLIHPKYIMINLLGFLHLKEFMKRLLGRK